MFFFSFDVYLTCRLEDARIATVALDVVMGGQQKNDDSATPELQTNTQQLPHSPAPLVQQQNEMQRGYVTPPQQEQQNQVRYTTPSQYMQREIGFFDVPPQYDQIWGRMHPDQRTVIQGVNMRVSWSKSEIRYVQNWLNINVNSPVRHLYQDIQVDPHARDIFHEHHSEVDKIAYIYKLLRK